MISEKAMFAKHLYAVFFKKGTGEVLLIKVGHQLVLPGGEVFRKDISGFTDERWKRGFLCFKVPDQTGITAYFIEEKVQPIPATYDVYSSDLKTDFSAIIVGEIDSFFVTKPNAKFYNLDELKKLVEEGKISVDQELLILRAFVSRDCPSKTLRNDAVPSLKEKHK